jgi:ABC-type nitrate/sulfonate/bicarbonate transport system substrate-binding protein
VPEHFNLPWRLALESGALADLGITWTDQPGGTGEMLAALADGALDVVSILTEGTVAAIADGLPATIVQVYVSSPLQWGIFVPGASDLQAEADLAGRPIAISRLRSGSHLMAFILARRHGWTIGPDQFVTTGNLDGARAAFAAGQAEVFLWDQFMTRHLVDTGEFRQVGVLPTPWPAFVVAARDEALLGRTTEVGRLVDAVVAEAASLARRPDVVELLTGRYPLSVDSARSWLASTSFGARHAWTADQSHQVLDTLVEAGFRSTAA